MLDKAAGEINITVTGSHQAGNADCECVGGCAHRVMVPAQGYAWQGTTYRSLSEVARAITGTCRNGPRFFGLPFIRSADGTLGDVVGHPGTSDT